jgi:hypothetical protein
MNLTNLYALPLQATVRAVSPGETSPEPTVKPNVVGSLTAPLFLLHQNSIDTGVSVVRLELLGRVRDWDFA